MFRRLSDLVSFTNVIKHGFINIFNISKKCKQINRFKLQNPIEWLVDRLIKIDQSTDLPID